MDIVFLVFCRISTFMLLLSTLGGNLIPTRVRLFFSLLLSIIVVSSTNIMNSVYDAPFILLLLKEITLGVALALVVNVYFAVTSIVSNILGIQSNITSTYISNINSTEQSTILNNFLFFMIIACIFSCNIHHVFIKGVIYSYECFPISKYIMINDWSTIIISAVTKTFFVSLHLASSCMLANIILVVASGVLSKLIPMLQSFVVLSPIQSCLVVFILAACMPFLIRKFMDIFSNMPVSYYG